ncbi:MAG: FMN-binding negative transcriptional regulator, partial [Gammaproteobacteria bacterium]|nr:FMN-binding negative transcriptional regulator [Gammaproteobacteria bacterium]
MYIPRYYANSDLASQHALIEEYNFACLLCHTETGLHGTHLPFLLDRARGKYGTLLSHLARANPQWRHFNGGVEAMVVFNGPHTYISPAWYSNRCTVPTWDYAAVHVYGKPVIIDNEKDVRMLLEQTVVRHETEN